MIHYIKHKDVDTEKWDRCIKQSINGIIYAYSWYLDIVCNEWDALIEDDYESVFPLVKGKKFGVNYLYPPFFTQQLGVFSKQILTEAKVNDFLNAIPLEYKYAEINLNTFNKVNTDTFECTPNLNYELDLINSYDNIRKNYSQNLKRNLKKAEESGFSIVNNIKPEDIIDLFRENRGKALRTYKEHDYFNFKRLVYSLIYKRKAEVLGVYTKRNELCAGAIFVSSNNKIIFLFSALSPEGRSDRAMPYLIDSFISENSSSNIVFDFEGSNDPNLARFYQSFGSKKCIYYQVRISKIPWPVKNAYSLLKKFLGK